MTTTVFTADYADQRGYDEAHATLRETGEANQETGVRIMTTTVFTTDFADDRGYDEESDALCETGDGSGPQRRRGERRFFTTKRLCSLSSVFYKI